MFKRKGRRGRKATTNTHGEDGNNDSVAGGSSIASSNNGVDVDAFLPPRSCLKRSFPAAAHNNYHSHATSSRSTTNNNSIDEGRTTDLEQQPQPQQRQSFNVRFLEVRIREFERIIGDNPSCSSGAPIGYVLLLWLRFYFMFRNLTEQQ